MSTEAPAAEADDPRIGVHVLAESLFCPRAGLLAHEQRAEDVGAEPMPEHLDYLPRYSLAEINRHLNRALEAMWQWVFGVAGLLVLTGALVILAGPAFLWSGVAALAVVAVPMARLARIIVALGTRRALAEGAAPAEPDPDDPEHERAGWWELRRAGFEAGAYKEPLVDDRLRLAGRPWKVLRRGAWTVPVFRRRATGPLRRQHVARIAAYCHLIEACEGARSPYGLVLDADRYEATAIKMTSAHRRAFHDGLRLARRVIRSTREREVIPAAPEDRSTCRRCPLGAPHVYRFGRTKTHADGRVLPVHGDVGPDGRTYHSACGDRFAWTPPHERAFAARLLRRG